MMHILYFIAFHLPLSYFKRNHQMKTRIIIIKINSGQLTDTIQPHQQRRTVYLQNFCRMSNTMTFPEIHPQAFQQVRLIFLVIFLKYCDGRMTDLFSMKFSGTLLHQIGNYIFGEIIITFRAVCTLSDQKRPFRFQAVSVETGKITEHITDTCLAKRFP